MKLKIALSSLIVAIVAVVAFSSQPVAAATITVNPGDSIQAAIDGATVGDVINIAAGTYTERIIVDKPLTINGAQTGVDARGRSGAETIIQGPTSSNTALYTIRVTSSDVTINGLTIETEAPTDAFHGIQVPGAANVENLHVLNNIVQDTGAGLFAYSGAVIDGVVVSRNAFLNNNRSDTSSSIYFANSVGSNVEISDNQIYDNDNDVDQSKAGINIGSATSSLSNVRIVNNEARNTRSFLVYHGIADGTISGNTAVETATAGAGMYIGLDVSDVTIDNNSLEGHLVGIRFGTNFPVAGGPSSNVTVTGNTITNMQTAGILVEDGAYAGTLMVTGNSLTGNTIGIDNQSSAVTVNANQNWWGCAEGPGAPGCDTIEGLVLASVWYVDAAMTRTNVDDNTSAPGVPNTSVAGGMGTLLAIAAGLAIGVSVIAVVVYRRRSMR